MAATTAPAASSVKSDEIAGRYSVLREGGKDTGCMITLDAKARGLKGGNKALLAPACRDQGIVIFDPVGWVVEKGRLKLTARKGHHTIFDQKGDGVWERKLARPITDLPRSKLTVSIKDRQGNVSRVERIFSVGK